MALMLPLLVLLARQRQASVPGMAALLRLRQTGSRLHTPSAQQMDIRYKGATAATPAAAAVNAVAAGPWRQQQHAV